MTLEQLKELSLHAVKGTAPENFSNQSAKEAVRAEFASMCKSINSFMRNRYDIYEVIMETADEVVPNKVNQLFSQFAEIMTVPQGQKAIFKRRLGRQRAKQFLTQVGLSGVYESFRLDNENYTVNTLAIGGAASIDFERMLDDAEIMSECMEIITEGLTEAVYGQIQRALIGAKDHLDSNKQVVSNTWDAEKMVKLVNLVKAYSTGGAVIFAPADFISEMGADAIVAVTDAHAGVYHPQDIDAIHNTGLINLFRGTPVVELPQSYTDETNAKTVINPQYAYIFPAGKEKVVKIVFEGNTQMWDYVNADQSMEVNVYKKFGVGLVSNNNWAIYQNTHISAEDWDASYSGLE